MLSRAEEARITGLHRRKEREREGLFLAEGVRVAEDLVASSLSLEKALITSELEDTPRGAALRAALEPRCAVIVVTAAELGRLAATDTPQGVVVVARTPVVSLDALEVPDRSPVLVLDAVQDPGNFGTMVRAADAFNAAFVAALPGTVDPWNPKTVRAAAGASFRTPVIQAGAPELGAWLHERDIAIFAADMDGEPADGMTMPARAALVVGNEGAGLSDAARAIVDRTIAVPMSGRTESLNVAVAAGILMYLMTRES